MQHIQYVPFGEIFIEQRNASWSTPYKFNGKELDEETGLAYYHARYYDPRTSVWLSVDPLAEKYPNIGSYVYCANNPVKYVDPDGRKVTLYYAKTTIGAGSFVGTRFAAYRGRANDNFGVTHFTFTVNATYNTKDMERYRPAITFGAGGYLGGIGILTNERADSFNEAAEEWGFSIGGGAIVTFSLGLTGDNNKSVEGWTAEIGFCGVGLSVGGEGGGNVNYVESISVSYEQANKIGNNKLWSVEFQEAIYNERREIIGYSGSIHKRNFFGKKEDTFIRVESGVKLDANGNKTSNGQWSSAGYRINKSLVDN